MEIEPVVDNVNDDIAAAMEELETSNDPADQPKDPAEEPAPAEEPKEPAADPKPEEEPKEPAEGEKDPLEKQDVKPEGEEEPKEPAVEPAPNSWGKNVTEKWADLPPEVRVEILKREEDIHRMATNQDQDRLFGRDMQKVLDPYIPTIQMAGGTPTGVIQNALNSMYALYTGTDQQKRDCVRDIIETYGVNTEGLLDQQEYQDPVIQQLQNEIKELRQQTDPNAMDQRLTQKMNLDRVNAEIEAFASNTENEYFEQVKPSMIALLNSGAASDLKDAYDQACWATPSIRSTLEAKKRAEEQAQRKQEIAKKKQAASSVVGSPATSNPPPKTNPNADVHDDVRAVYENLSSEL